MSDGLQQFVGLRCVLLPGDVAILSRCGSNVRTDSSGSAPQTRLVPPVRAYSKSLKEFTIRQNIDIRKGWAIGLRTICRRGDAGIQKQSVRTKDRECQAKIFLKVGFSDVLDHPDTDQLVAGTELLKIAIIKLAHFAAVRQAGSADTILSESRMSLAESDPHSAGPVLTHH